MLLPALERADELLGERGLPSMPEGVSPHKLRRTFASALVASGEDPASVMSQLGHTDPKFTLKVYTHMMRRSPGEKERLTVRLRHSSNTSGESILWSAFVRGCVSIAHFAQSLCRGGRGRRPAHTTSSCPSPDPRRRSPSIAALAAAAPTNGTNTLNRISGPSCRSCAVRPAWICSKAIRGLRARHRYLLTGTPISNYVNDVFWLLWWTLGNATLRFPFDYEGGRAKFEADFCVIEYWRRDGRRENRKVLPQVTNVSRLWRLLSGAMVRRRKQHMGELPPRTTRTIAAPMGKAQLDLYKFWLNSANFERYFAWKHPGHPLLEAGLVERFAAGLGQLTKLEYATTLPAADPDQEWSGLDALAHSNWTPKNLKVLQVALEHVGRGEKVLIGSDLIETGRWLCERLREKGVDASHIVEERGGKAATMNPRRRAKAIEAFKTGKIQVLCCGIPSIRLGHSLEAASCVIATGLVFSYEMFDQFIARAWRLTSPGPVSVYVALTLGSLDPKKWELLCQKAKAADLALDGQLVDEPEQPISREELLRELRKQGVEASGEEIAEEDIRMAWEATAMLRGVAAAGRPAVNGDPGDGGRRVDWHSVNVDEPEQLDLFGVV